MRKFLMWIVTVPLLLSLLLGISGCTPTKDEWYKDTIEYYRKAVVNGVEGNNRQLSVSPEIKGKGKLIGYLLYDLDGDGRDELLIGYNSGGAVTKFIHIVVKHSDFGAYSLLSGGNGGYYYLCEDGVLKEESWRGDEMVIKYLKFESRSNSFAVLDDTYTPKSWKLTTF